MNTTPTDDVVLNQDLLGRVKRPEACREQLLDEFERRGVSGQKFAELVGVKYQTIATWVQRRRVQRGTFAGMKVPVPSRRYGCWKPGDFVGYSCLANSPLVGQILFMNGSIRRTVADGPLNLASNLLREKT